MSGDTQKSSWNFRLAVPEDAENFSRWAATNIQIDPSDLRAGMRANNPTVLWFVAEKDGVPMAFAPVYLSAVLAHLGFNPDTRAAEKLQALTVLKDGVSALMVQFGIREIQTLTKPGYGVAQWASKNGFDVDSRMLYRLDLNKILERSIPEEVKADV